MKTKVDHRLAEFAKRVGKVRWIKFLLAPFYNFYLKRLEKNRRKLFLDNGIETLREFDSLLASNGYGYSVFFGTLLGAVREKGFIRHDLDIDVCVWMDEIDIEAFHQLLEGNGFRWQRAFLINGGKLGREETFSKNGVDIDIFYICSDEVCKSYVCCFKRVEGCATLEQSMEKYGYVATRRLDMPVDRELERLPFESIEVNAIANAQDFLSVCYGADYMTPDPVYVPVYEDKVRYDWDKVKAVYVNKR